ncbi:hypothetical protein ACMYR3_03110 [Ampullimonas aquatilis]|uniref:hypothetical protein n=1 Tax=Ampullimonas aquatilis TaxID=1341549 RepID=UPI003C7789CE
MLRQLAIICPSIMLFCHVAIAQENSWGLSAAPAVVAQKYEEFDNDGSRLVKETATSWVLGVNGFYQFGQDWRIVSALQYSQPDFHYDGQTQQGAPLQTITDMEFLIWGVQGEHRFEVFNHALWAIAGIEHERRDRNIRSTATVGGLHEHYRIWSTLLGARIDIYSNDHVQIAAQVIRQFGAKSDQNVTIPTLAASGNGKTGRSEGLRISIPVLLKQWGHVTITPSISYTYTSRGDYFDLHKDNQNFAQAVQPAYRQKSFGLTVDIPIK